MLMAMRLNRAVFHCCHCLVALAILTPSISPTRAFAACKVSKMAELPVTMSNLRPLITEKINDTDVQFVVDSGAFFSMISAASAAELKLKLHPAPFGLRVTGVGGSTDASVAIVKVFTLQGIPIHNVEFLVGGSEAGAGSIGLLGQNVLRIGDVEYDLAKGVIRLIHVEDCKHTRLAYWVDGTQPYSVMDIESTTPSSPHTTGTAFVNGARIRVMFDTGAATSVLSLRAAERAGIKPDTPGVVDAGFSSGIGRSAVKTFIGPIPSFKIGDEEIKNTRLRFGNIDLETADMLIGADFFLSHRVYVATSQHRLYFTYNGGAVFNLTASAKMPSETAAGTAAGTSEPTDAADYSRRGAASAARRDFERALADLTRACELAPNDAGYFYQRGVIYLETKQTDPALADFNRALELKPDDVPALVARAELRLAGSDRTGASADLDAADRIAPKEADVRLLLAHDYQRADLSVLAVAQLDLWILSHTDDARMADALYGRCWLRALQGQDLPKALNDCNSAFRMSSKSGNLMAQILNSRGLVRLRLGDYDKSIADYDASLKLYPQDAWSLYGRGVAKMRRNKAAEGEADIADAKKLWPNVADEFTRRGITP
jgi:tetratricopeptide (TPR) repeat protein/predicted aspartyl protease